MLNISTPAFEHGSEIPEKYSCESDDLSPAFQWTAVPGAKSYALIGDDPDAPNGTWVHWLVYDIPASVTELSEGLPKSPALDNGAKQGSNDFGRLGYGGPCPRRGTHRYYFKLYALDTTLPDLPPGTSKEELLQAMDGHIVERKEIMGTYTRSVAA